MSEAKKILIVDDEPGLRTLLAQLLAKEAFSVLQAADGKEAVRQTERERPDLVILDIVLEGMDGFEVYRLIRDNPLTRATPVIFMTGLCGEGRAGRTQLEIMARAKHGGEFSFDPMVQVLAKPYSVGRLIRAIRQGLEPHKVPGGASNRF
ncbi:MAG: hypothetical protein COV76_03610 [Candidatus Omnitrophica bacterium CG11_big_fil_rev_8_21_14_0_20_64_10]|nr:MAG: hypothetical protein COV76_03610 [Candidatus Omnitrophica bacterium CG11_big_fil_rev_8_21_14_0_20_64_10]